MTTLQAPVLIVGRGPVGMTLALRLAGFGIASVLADKLDDQIRLSSKAVLMHGESVEVLERAGVGRHVASTGVALSGSRTFYRDHELFHTVFEHADHGFPQVVNFPQSETERLLLARVTEEPLIDLRLGTELVGLDVDEHGATAQFEDGLWVRADYVAGCDGARSVVRGQLPIRFSGHAHDEHYLIVDIRARLALPNERRFHFDPRSNRRRTTLVHPQHDDLWHIDFQVGAPPDLEQEQRSGRLDERIRGVIGAARYELVWSTTYVFKQLIADRFAYGRAFLVGDAAHLYAPYGARGLNSGFADADNLAWKLAWVLHGRSPATLLDSYDDERRAAATEHFRITSSTAQFMAPTTWRGRLYRDVVLAVAARVPAARRWVDSGKFYSPVGFPDSPIVTDGSRELGGVPAGALMPDAPLRMLDGSAATRLRDHVGDRFLLVHQAADPAVARRVRKELSGLPEDQVTVLTLVPPGAGGDAAAGVAEGLLPGAPTARPGGGGRLLLVRPDCHVAGGADLESESDALDRATALLDRAAGRSPSGPGARHRTHLIRDDDQGARG